VDHHAFARAWQDAWNSHDLDRILAHYREDVVFRSRKAVDVVGSAEVRGKAALRRYWALALAAQPDLRFTVQGVYVGPDILVLTYENHKGVLAAETLRFDATGLVVDGSASHALSLSDP